MKSLNWIFFIPIGLIAYFIAIMGFTFVYSLIPSFKENPVLDYFVMPSIINVIGILMCFSTARAVFNNKNERTATIILSVVIIIVQFMFLVSTLNTEEYGKVISSMVGVLVGILPLIESKNTKNDYEK